MSVEPRLPWSKPLIEIERYVISEWYLVEPTTGDKHWFYFYNDDSFETLTMRNNKK